MCACAYGASSTTRREGARSSEGRWVSCERRDTEAVGFTESEQEVVRLRAQRAVCVYGPQVPSGKRDGERIATPFAGTRIGIAHKGTFTYPRKSKGMEA